MGGQRVCAPIAGQSVRHRTREAETQHREQFCWTVGKAVWNSHNWLVQHHTSTIFIFFFFFKVKFFLLSLNTYFLQIPAVGPPLISVSWPVLCLYHLDISLYLLNRSFIWRLTIAQLAWKRMMLFLYWAHLKVKQDHTVVWKQLSVSAKHLPDGTLLGLPSDPAIWWDCFLNFPWTSPSSSIKQEGLFHLWE